VVRDKEDRIDILARHAREGDLVLCTGFATSEILAQAYRRGLSLEVVTFPRSLRRHVGWYNPDDELDRGEDALRAEAEEIVRDARARPRAWLVVQAGAAGGAHARLIEILRGALAAEACQALYEPREQARWRELGVCALACGAPVATTGGD
jgi:hypothetical protein